VCVQRQQFLLLEAFFWATSLIALKRSQRRRRRHLINKACNATRLKVGNMMRVWLSQPVAATHAVFVQRLIAKQVA